MLVTFLASRKLEISLIDMGLRTECIVANIFLCIKLFHLSFNNVSLIFFTAIFFENPYSCQLEACSNAPFAVSGLFSITREGFFVVGNTSFFIRKMVNIIK